MRNPYVLIVLIAALFTALSKQATLVALVEDWHWADSASRAVLVRMRDIVAKDRLLFAVTTRPESDVLMDGPAERTMLRLEPLDLTASAAMVEAGLGASRVSEMVVPETPRLATA